MRIILFTFFFVATSIQLKSQSGVSYGNPSSNEEGYIIKADNSYVYTISASYLNGTEFPIITKFNKTTYAILWQKRLTFSIRINDAVFIGNDNIPSQMYLVGHSLPEDINNNSILLKLDLSSGAIICSQTYNHYGSERFSKIIRHDNPLNTAFPYYILGIHTVNGNPNSAIGKVVLWNISANCETASFVNFTREYNLANDDEFHRGLVALNDKTILLTGNRVTDGFGMVVNVDGNGNVIRSRVLSVDMEVEDGVQLNNGNFIFVGEEFIPGNRRAIVFMTDKDFNFLTGFRTPNIDKFDDIQTSLNGNIYVVGNHYTNTFSTIKYPVVFRIGYTSTVPFAMIISKQNTLDYNVSNSYKSSAINFKSGIIHYIDGRSQTSNFNVNIAQSDSNVDFACQSVYQHSVIGMEFTTQSVNVTTNAYTRPTFTGFTNSDVVIPTTTWCGVPCNLEVSTIKTQINNCGLYSITANVSGGTNPYTYSWDIGCNLSIEGNTNPINHQFNSGGTIPYCITVTDATGCSKTLSNQTIVVTGDFVPPVITCPANATISCDADPLNYLLTGTATAVDVIDPSPTVSHVQDVTNNNNNCSSTITRTWKATDDCGNMSTCQQLIIIKDLTGPVVDCPDNISVGCESDLYDPMITGNATATDNCNSLVELQPTLAGSGTSCTLEWIKMYRFQDECGNIGTCTQLITTYDNTDPIITCPANLTLSCGANTDPSQTGFATATDACQTELSITYLDAVSGNDCDKTITRTWSANDGCTNVSSCMHTIRLRDLTPPTFICPSSNLIPIECTANPSLGVPTNIMDNCGGIIDQAKVDVFSTNGCISIINRTWTVTDKCGNSATCEQVIKMEDKEPPVISGCGRKNTIQGIRNVDGICRGDVTLISPSIFDHCDEEVLLTNSYTLTNDASGSYPVGQTIIIWTAKDDCGLMAMCQDTIIILDCPDCCWDSDSFNELTATEPQIRRENCATQISIPGLTACQRVKIDWGDGTLSGYLTTPAVFDHDYLVSGDYQACALFEEIAADGTVCYSETVCYDICVECGPECEENRLVYSCHDIKGVQLDFEQLYRADLIESKGFIYTANSEIVGSTQFGVVSKVNSNCETIDKIYFLGSDRIYAGSIKALINDDIVVGGIYHGTSISIPSLSTGTIILPNNGYDDGYVACLEPNLSGAKWAFSIGDNWDDYINDMATDGNFIFVCGRVRGNINFGPLGYNSTTVASPNIYLPYYSAFVAKYNGATGVLEWFDVLEPNSNASVSHYGIDVYGDHIFLSGELNSTHIYSPYATILDGTGNIISLNCLPGENKTTNYVLKYLPAASGYNKDVFHEVSPLNYTAFSVKTDGVNVYVGGFEFIRKYNFNLIPLTIDYQTDFAIYDIELNNNDVHLIGTTFRGNPPQLDFINHDQNISVYDYREIPLAIYDGNLNFKKGISLGGYKADIGYGLLVHDDNLYIQGSIISQDFRYDPENEANIISHIGLASQRSVYFGKYSCECTEEIDCCKETTATLSGSDPCCKSIDLVNQADFQVTHIGVEVITPGWDFGPSTIGSGYSATSVGSEYIIQHISGLIPVGNINGIFDFCLAGTGAIPTTQQIVVRWYETSISGNMTVVCSDTLDLFCDPVPLPIACLDYTLISVVCDPDNDLSYFMTFSITNLTSDVNATSVYLSGLPAGFYFESCVGGGLVTSINIPISPPIGPGQTSGTLCVKINTSSGLISPEDVCFDLQLKGLDGIIYTCCNAPEPECINIQPCCDPCEDISFTVEPLEENQDGCCYALIVDNSCQYDYFTKMEIQVNTADVHFGYINAATGWSNCATPSLQSLCIQPNSGIFPNGDYVPTLGFCLSNINDASQVPQDIVISLYSTNDLGVEFIACEKPLQLSCDTIPNDSCLIVTNATAFCDPENEKYLVSVTIENNSNPDFCANEVVITPLDLGDVMPSVILLPDFLCHGESTTINFMVTDLPFPDTDGMFEVLFSLKNNISEECCQGGVAHIDTILLPDCPCAATCCEDLPEHDFESYNLGNLPNTQVGWQDILGIPSVVPDGAGGSAQSVLLPAHSRGLMPSAIEYRHAGVGGPDLILPENSLICLNFWAKLNPIPTLPVNGVLTIRFDHTTVYSLTIPYTNSVWTYYELNLITPPGGVYTLQFINHSAAPLDYGPSIQVDDLCFEVKNLIYNDITPPDITCPDDITILDTDLDCIVEYFIPDLSVTDLSGIAAINYYLNGNLVMIGSAHPLDNTMNHEVVCIAEDVCGNQETCTFYIMVECAENCCFDEMKFLSSVESAVTYTVDNSNCTATINIGDLPDCDYLQNINWGDGTNMSGPFTGGEVLAHTYIGNGSYTISMLAIETNPTTGFNCFEHVISREISLNCSGCICPTVPPIFTISQGQMRTDVTCGNMIQLDCPVTDLFINGIFRCESTIPGQSCPPNSISWVLDRPTLPDMSGTSGATVSFMLGVVAVQEPGLYTLTFSTLCADSPAPCICSISWIQPDCNPNTFCPDNIISNGDFELGNPSGTNDDINMATGWGGIWGSNGSETGEYLSTNGGPFSFPHPIPASQNGYAGFWLDKSSDNSKREGIMNQLNTIILPNTGCYSVEFKIACIGGQYNSPTLEIYGVNVGALATTATISQVAPSNNNLFTPPPVLLGSYLVNTDVCNNNFMTVTIDFDSGIIPPGGFDRIFFTRQDLPAVLTSRGAFVAMDDICLSSLPCNPVCTCPANPIISLQKGNDIFQITCGQIPPQIPQLGCPVSDLFINGIFNCESSIPGQSCLPNSVNWDLDRPTLTNLTGTSGSTVSVMLDAVDVQEPGVYSLTFTTICSDSPEPCVCSISWIQPDCNQDNCPSCPSGSVQGNNLVKNGDFALGNDGSFISEYTFLNTGLLNSGNYGVRNSLTLSNANWASLDHTTFNPNGLFLVADGTNPGQFIWQQSIPVTEGNTYEFCAWINNLVINLQDSNSPMIEVHANGNVIVGPTLIPQIPDNWILLSGTYTATTTGIIDIQVFNMATTGYSDIAIDDITFIECLRDTCCRDEKEFINSTETACGLGKDPDNCILYLNIDLLNPCVKIDLIEWGDGMSTAGPLTTGQLLNHTYATSGLYQIKVTFSEYSSLGVKCWSNVWESNRISLDCKSTPKCVCDKKGFKIGRTNVDCDNAPVLIPCPDKSPVFISGYIGCLPTNVCNTNNVTYVIKDIDGVPVVNGVLNANSFNLQLIGSWFSPSGGTYNIEFTTYCNGSPCKCRLNFIVPSCPKSCLCDQSFNTDIDLGFDIQNFKGGCKKKLTPNKLCPKDKVTWTLNGVVVLPSTFGEDPKYITLTNPTSNNVCMIVNREENSNIKCRDTFCMIFPGCTISNPIPQSDTCIWPHNSTFTNAIDGLFHNEGSVKNWELKKGDGFVSTDMGLTYDNVVLISNKNNSTDLYQSCCIDPLNTETKKLVKASVFLQSLGIQKLPIGCKLQIIMPKDVTIDPEAKIIAEIDLTTIKSEWAEYDFQILEQNFCNVNNNLFIRFVNPSENDEAIRIDNLCFELDTCTVGANDLTGTDFIILPNPTSGQLTIDFKTQINQSLTLRVYDVLGRELNLEYIKEGTSYYNLSIKEIAGIYIIQLSDINGESTQRKVIKIE